MNINEVIRLTVVSGFTLIAGAFLADVVGKRMNEHKAIKLRAELLTTYMTGNTFDEDEAENLMTEINDINK